MKPDNRFPLSYFRLRARGHNDREKPDHPLGSIYDAIRDDFQAKCQKPVDHWHSGLAGVAPATLRRLIFIRPPGALVPASAPI
jgi:hypothetical protein